jgi:hypothetical protein
MDATIYHDIQRPLRQHYLDDSRPRLVGFSDGKYSTVVASLIQRKCGYSHANRTKSNPEESVRRARLALCHQSGWRIGLFLAGQGPATLADLWNILLQKLSQPPAFGIWRHEPMDALAYQKKLRGEWEGE